jgi:hypothetical protein
LQTANSLPLYSRHQFDSTIKSIKLSIKIAPGKEDLPANKSKNKNKYVLSIYEISLKEANLSPWGQDLLSKHVVLIIGVIYDDRSLQIFQ